MWTSLIRIRGMWYWKRTKRTTISATWLTLHRKSGSTQISPIAPSGGTICLLSCPNAFSGPTWAFKWSRVARITAGCHFHQNPSLFYILFYFYCNRLILIALPMIRKSSWSLFKLSLLELSSAIWVRFLINRSFSRTIHYKNQEQKTTLLRSHGRHSSTIQPILTFCLVSI